MASQCQQALPEAPLAGGFSRARACVRRQLAGWPLCEARGPWCHPLPVLGRMLVQGRESWLAKKPQEASTFDRLLVSV